MPSFVVFRAEIPSRVRTTIVSVGDPSAMGTDNLHQVFHHASSSVTHVHYLIHKDYADFNA